MQRDMTKGAYDVIVVGAGHAGCEAALAAARIGCKTLVFTLNIDNIALMSCNPAIGGIAKGHLVREIDALGGEMARVTDMTGIQFRMLNTSKGPAVQAIRAQVDRNAYKLAMRAVLESHGTPRIITVNPPIPPETLMPLRGTNGHENPSRHPDPELDSGVSGSKEMLKQVQHDRGTAFSDERGFSGENIDIIQGMVERLLVKDGRVRGVETNLGIQYESGAVILTTGTFLRGLIHIGMVNYPAGRAGEFPSVGLSEDLSGLGFKLGRLKTGTPPRLNARTIDFSVMTEQHGDVPPPPFSYTTERIEGRQVPCYLTYTSPATHEIIRKNLDRSPLYGGVIKGIGPRYCPSIEDKVVRFSHKEKHQVFLEPEGYETVEMYANGISTSLPLDVQVEIVRSVRGLEEAEIMRPGYAIEYDFVPPTQVKQTLETKLIEGLYNAGQINGTSGYEEAAAQGIIAGINAALKIQGREPFVLDRSEAYIGVLIDDLVTKGTQEPYRMFTSRAEYRLLLRHDNADSRLTEKGYNIGIISPERYKKFGEKRTVIDNEIARLKRIRVGSTKKVENSVHCHCETDCHAFRLAAGSVSQSNPKPGGKIASHPSGARNDRVGKMWGINPQATSHGSSCRVPIAAEGQCNGWYRADKGFSDETHMSHSLTKDYENPPPLNPHPALPHRGGGEKEGIIRALPRGEGRYERLPIIPPPQKVQTTGGGEGEGERRVFSDEIIKMGKVLPDTTLAQLLQRPEIDYDSIEKISPPDQPLDREIKKRVEIEIKYDGYIKRQLQLVERFRNLETNRIPVNLDYSSIAGLSREVVEKLVAIRPASLGQASRISGVTPAAISILAIVLAKESRGKA